MIKSPSEEDELDDLPPLDGMEGEDEADETDEELDEEPSDGLDPMDDSTAEGDPLEEIEVSGSESGWLEDAGESDGLDVGAPDTFGAEEENSTLLEGAEDPDLSEEELSLGSGVGGYGGAGESIVGDAGEEGFEDEEEDLHEEDLPRLDSGQDDTAEADDADLLEALPEEDAIVEDARPPWNDRAWERVESTAPEPSLPLGLAVSGAGGAGVFAIGHRVARLAGDQVEMLDALGPRGRGDPQCGCVGDLRHGVDPALRACSFRTTLAGPSATRMAGGCSYLLEMRTAEWWTSP